MIEKWIQYTCDGCGETESDGDPNVSAKDVRARIKKDYGWRKYGRLDYCPDCVHKGLAAERVEGFGG